MPGRLPKNEDAEAGRSGNETSPLIEKPREVSLLHPVQWLRTLSQSYTWKLLAMVACTNHLLKGFVAGGGDEGLIGKPAEFLFGELGVSAGRLQSLKAVAIIPFALKPLVALLSDAFPIAGYHKLPYVVIFTVLSFGALMTLGLGLAVSEAAVVTALFLAFLQVASIDVLMAAKSSEEVKKHAKLGPDFMTYTWLGINVGQVLSAFRPNNFSALSGPSGGHPGSAGALLLCSSLGLGRALASPWQLHGGAPHSAAGLAHGLPATQGAVPLDLADWGPGSFLGSLHFYHARHPVAEDLGWHGCSRSDVLCHFHQVGDRWPSDLLLPFGPAESQH